MPWPRIAAIGAAVMGLLWVSLDGGLGGRPPAPAMASASLAVLALLLAGGSWTTRMGEHPERAPLMAGLAAGTGVYALLRLTLPG
jgi:hypothetical protein